MSERILAIDPGEKVGWAHGVLEGDELELTGHGINGLRDFATALSKRFGDYDVVIYETFRLHPAYAKALVGNDMQTSQLIGIIRYLGWMRPHVKVVAQGPNKQSTGEKTAPPCIREVLDNLPKSHDDAHDGSALKHLAYYLHSLRKEV